MKDLARELWEHKGFITSLIVVFVGLPAAGRWARRHGWIP